MRRKRERDYLFQRPGSRNWHIRFQGEERTERSLGVSDRRQADILALPLIAAHRVKVLARQQQSSSSRWYEYPPGRLHAADAAILAEYPTAKQILATADIKDGLTILDQDGAVIGRMDNGGMTYLHSTRSKEPSFELFDRERERTSVAKKDTDDALFETYLQHANVGPKYVSEARQVWELYKSLVGKPLKDASRDDGRRLAAHFEAQGNKSATIQKKIGWLTSAVNLAISDGKLKFNPFSSVVTKKKDALRRLPLDADDIANIKRNLHRLSETDQLLVRVLATTGCGLSEAYEIKGEAVEGDVRYVVLGHKTEQRLRRVPLPADLLPFLPVRIAAPLFQGDAGRPSRTLGKFLRDIGIKDPRKVLYCLRHRAKDRLRAAGCPLEVQYELLGHEEFTVASGYGRGSPVPLLKEWIDRIGF